MERRSTTPALARLKAERKSQSPPLPILDRPQVSPFAAPDQPDPFDCIHRGEKLRDEICETCGRRGQTEAIYTCAIHGECSLRRWKVIRRNAPHVCLGCDDQEQHEPGQKSGPQYHPVAVDFPGLITINHGAGGLGDALLASCAVLGFSRLHPGQPIHYKIHPRAIPFVELFDAGYQSLAKHDWDNCADLPKGAKPGEIQINVGYNRENKTKCARPRVMRWANNLGPDVVPERPKLRDRAALAAECPPEYRGVVALSPFSTWHCREYPIHAFRTVERMLLELGYRVLTLDATDSRWPNRHNQMKGEKLVDAPARTVAAILLNAVCFVGNDSGLAHLSAMLDMPTLVLCGQVTRAGVYGFYGEHVQALEGHLDCRGCFWQDPCDSPRCDTVCANLASNTPEEIVTKVVEMAWVPAGGRVSAAAVSTFHSAAGETDKAYGRRVREGWFDRFVKSPAIDIGCGRDPLIAPFPTFPIRRWDQMLGDGDCAKMAGVESRSFLTVYASHVLEHLVDPVAAVRRWFELVAPGGHLIVVVPHRDLYEGQTHLPSRWNGDHKTHWLPILPCDSLAPLPKHLRGLEETISEALKGEGSAAELVSLRILDEGHAWPDKSLHPAGEYSIEAVIRRAGA